MSKFVNQKIDITGWNKVVKELQKIKGGTYKEILKSECAEILQQTANRKSTKLADKSKIVGRHMPVKVYFMGYKGKKEAYTLKVGEAGVKKQTTYFLAHRLPNPVWDYISAKVLVRTDYAYKNYGLNKGQFYLMAKKLGINKGSKSFPDASKDFVQSRANIISNKVFAYESGKKDKKYKIELESKLSKILSFGNGAKNFKNVMKGRVRKFEKALGKGVMNDIKKRTRAYPLIFNK